jgi:DNA-binding CsgD family transcriptional regulator
METNVNSAPAAFEENKVEIFILNGEVVFLENGRIRPFEELPESTLTLLREDLNNDTRALKGIKILGILDPGEQLRQFAYCRFGDFDKAADLDEEGNTITEYWNCGRRPCPADGYLCKLPEVPFGRLTPHETEIIRMISSDIPNKQIASHNGTSVHTVNTQVKNIARKVGCFTKTGIASFAGRNNIF